MITRDLGKVAITPQGEWDSEKIYTKLDLVYVDGSSYVYINNEDTSGHEVTEEDYWQLSAKSGNDGDGISSIALISTSGLQKTYRITRTSGATFNFVVTDGNGIVSVTKTATSGLTDTYTIIFDNGNVATFTVTNAKSISSIVKGASEGLTDNYIINFNDGTTFAYQVINGKSAYAYAVEGGYTGTEAEFIQALAYLPNIYDLIPTQASADNQLADKNFVNSTVGTNTANYISKNGQPFNSLAELEAYTGDVTNNDYAFVVGTDSAGNTTYTRYKYNSNTEEWAEEYVLNNSSFTASQWASIQSGITALLVAQISTNAEDIVTLQGQMTTAQGNIATLQSGKADKSTTYTKTEVDTALTEKVNIANIEHETWTFTLDDDTEVDKEVVLWTSQG